jgi:multidrug resistance efflux pump
MKTYCRPLHLCLILGVAGLALALVGAHYAQQPAPPGAAPANFSCARGGVVCFGHVDMEHGIASLYPLVQGRVARIEVSENQAVTAGTVLLRLDDYQAGRRVHEAEAELLAAQEQLVQARKLPRQLEIRLNRQRAAIEAVAHRLEGARAGLATKKRMQKKKLASADDVEAAAATVRELIALERAEQERLRELQLEDPCSAVRKAEAGVKAKQAQLEQARRGVEECALKAPADGTVLRMLVSPGDVLGLQPRQPAVEFCPTGRRLIRAEVEQEFADQVATGQTALIEDDARSRGMWTGRVLRVSDWYTKRRSILLEPSQFNDVRTLECLVAVDPGQPSLRIGQRVRVTFHKKKSKTEN